MSLIDSLRKASGPVKWRPEILMDPPKPQPMHGVSPRTVLGRVWWEQTRKAAYGNMAHHCAACGIWKGQAKGRRWLEGHERYRIDYLLGTLEYVETVPLCHYCHNYVHPGRLQALLDQGKITWTKYKTVVQHGDEVLRRAGLKKPEPYQGPMVDWKDWRLVVDGKEYRPKFKSERSWNKEYGG